MLMLLFDNQKKAHDSLVGLSRSLPLLNKLYVPALSPTLRNCASMRGHMASSAGYAVRLKKKSPSM